MRSRSEVQKARLAWVLTWVAYATYYLGRKGLSVAKKPLEADLHVTRGELAAIDTGHLAAYAVGQLANGLLADRIGARRLVGFGMLLSAAMCAWFGSASTVLVFALAFAVNGYAQATGWPGATRSVAEWTDATNRRRVMALWCTCYQVGGIAATAGAAWLLRYGWRAAFYVPAAILAAIGILILLALPESTTRVVANEGAPPTAPFATPPGDPATVRKEAVRKALASQTLWFFGASYFAIKLVRYSLLFWLPYYLADDLGYGAALSGYVATAFEVGGVVGVVGIGLYTHRARHVSRAALAAVVLALLGASLILYTRLAPLGVVANALGLALVGACLFGPDSLISGAVAQDVGGPHAAATATGLVNAVGSVGAVLQGALNAWVSRAFGWHAVFLVFVGLSFAAALSLVPTLARGDSR